MSQVDEDARAIRSLAARIATAESSGDAKFLLEAFTDDAVIMPPFLPAVEGPDARALLINEVLTRNAEELVSRELSYEISELQVLGDWAFERGTYLHSFVPKDPTADDENEERGQYLRLYQRSVSGEWRVARVIWNLIPNPEPEPGQV
jgi:ketosteroid isomerase-like protein